MKLNDTYIFINFDTHNCKYMSVDLYIFRVVFGLVKFYMNIDVIIINF